MEYCSTTLRKIIDDSATTPLDVNEIWRLVRQIVEALVYIHSQQIIHRDLVSHPRDVPLDFCGILHVLTLVLVLAPQKRNQATFFSIRKETFDWETLDWPLDTEDRMSHPRKRPKLVTFTRQLQTFRVCWEGPHSKRNDGINDNMVCRSPPCRKG